MNPQPLKILLSGGNGQLGSELQRQLADLGQVIALGRDRLDLAQPEQIRQQIRALRPDLIINAAAHTAVDLAESQPALAMAINAQAPGIFAQEAATLGVPLIHYSSDYVFDGHKPTPYTEADPPKPLSIYGRSKLAGEQAISAIGGQHLILRTSWVYSAQGHNFLLTMQRLLQAKPELRIVADQFGAPTWTGTLAQATRALIERWQTGQPGPWGLYHLCASGETSWFGFAQAIAGHLSAQGKPCAHLLPIPASAYPTAAARPLNSRLDCQLIRQQWPLVLPHWRDALADCLTRQGSLPGHGHLS